MVPGPCHGETRLTHLKQPRWKMYCEGMSDGSTSGMYMFTSIRLAVFEASFAGCTRFDAPTDCQPASSSSACRRLSADAAAEPATDAEALSATRLRAAIASSL